ncbi:MAG: DUF805 domain-containing protein [Hyphomonadaceae bacterium]|nr:DUF805 domain-containing protein [Hyphomonadaceae bacterium]
MTDVFISYAREDSAQAERISRGLEAMGLSVFWDNEIPPGQTWADYIEEKLNHCNVAVVLWSQHSTKSQWVREEARMGRSKLIPAKLDVADPPFGFGDVQAADLSHWAGDYNHPEWGRFANAVFAKARPASSTPQPAAAPIPHVSPTPQPPSGGWQQPQSNQSSGAWQTPPPAQQGWTQQSGGGAHAAAETLSPVGYIQKCLRLYVDGKGRARRAEYGWFFVFAFVLGAIASVLDITVGGTNYMGMPNSQIITLIVGLALIAPTISAASRRAHDFGQSGWLAALICVPYLGWIAALVFIFIPGQPGPNQHGPNPKGV